MKRYGLGYLGAGAALICFSMAGAALAQDISPPGRPTQQELQEIRSTYIVQFAASVDPSEVAGRANAIAARFNGVVTNTYDTALKGFAIRMNDRALTNMIRTTGLDIISVSRDAPVTAYAPGGKKGKPTNPGGGGSCGETLGWDIKRITAISQNSYGKTDPDSCNVVSSASLNYSGSGLMVCVIDTGVDSAHKDLNVDATLGENFSNDKGGTEDLNGHGTHVAGTIGALANNDIGVVGVAPGAEIIPIKVLNRRGSGSFAGVIDGVDHAAKIGCDIANMSLGGETTSTALDNAVKGARSAGVIFTLAAGNSAEDVATHTPARASEGPNDNIFTIASFGQDSAGADLWSYFSNYDDPTKEGVVDFVLPGGAIKSTWLADGYNTISGTSMAAPHMAGLLVRLLAADSALNPTNCKDPADQSACQTLTIVSNSNTKFDNGGSVNRTAADSYNVPADY